MPALSMTNQQALARAAARRKVNEQYMSADNRALATRLERITETFPTLNTATAVTLAEAGYTNDSVEVQAVGKLQAKRDEGRGIGGWLSDQVEQVADNVKSANRTAFSTLGAAIEAPEAMFRTAYRAGQIVKDDGFGAGNRYLEREGSLGDIANQTRIGSAVDVANDTGLSVGAALNNNPRSPRDAEMSNLLELPQSTWFSGTNSLAEKRQVANTRRQGLIFDSAHPKGRAITEGRAVGRIVRSQPGGVANSLVAGLLKIAGAGGAGDDPRDGMSPRERAAWEKKNTVGGIAPTAYVDDSWEGKQAIAQKLIEGSVDATVAASKLDVVNALSVARGAQVRNAGKFGGNTVKVEVPQPAVKVMANVKDKATGQRTQAPIVVDGGTRPTVVPKNADDFINKSRKGDMVAEYLSKETNYPRLAAVLGRDTPPATIIAIIDETDPVRMKALLTKAVGDSFIDRAPKPLAADLASVGMETGKVAAFTSAHISRSKSRQRQLGPSESWVYRSDPAWAMEQYTRMVRSLHGDDAGGALSRDFLDKNIEQVARKFSDPDGDWSAPVIEMLDAAKQSLIVRGVPVSSAERIVAQFHKPIAEDRNFWIDGVTGEHRQPFVMVDGEELPQAKGWLSAEKFTDGMPLLDPVEFNKAASKVSAVLNHPGYQGAVAVGDLVTAFFKFNVLATRGVSYAMRNVAEMQGRMAVEGASNVFSSPLAATAWRLGDNTDSDAARLLGRRDRHRGRGAYDTAGEDYQLRAALDGNASLMARVMETKGGPYTDDRVLHMNKYPIVKKGDDGWIEGHRFTLGKLSGSEEVLMALKAPDPQTMKAQFWASDIRKKMADSEDVLTTREGSDLWVDRVIYPRIEEVTGGHPDLKNAIRQGRINGHPLVSRDARGNLVGNRKALDELERYRDVLPDHVVSPGTVRATSDAGQMEKGVEAFEKGVMTPLFHAVSAVPNNRFVNSPLFREMEWTNAVRTIGLGTAEARQALIANAKKANMSKQMIRDLKAVTGPPGVLDSKDLRNLNQTKAFNQWLDIVYTSHRKGNWSRSVRMIGPFAAAIADMYRFWGKRLAKNPLMLHRVEVGMRAARQEGTFYTDDNGEERFMYPLSGALGQVFGGTAKQMSGAVSSVNVLVSGLHPGFGPSITWNAAWAVPDGKDWDPLRKFINPYGDPDAAGGLLEGMQARHVQRFMVALGQGSPEQKRLYGEALGDTMAYLASTGQYGKSADERIRLENDAKAKGQMLWLVQAFAQANVPVSPKGEFKFLDPSGRAIAVAKIAADYRKMLNADPETANQNLLGKYGDAVFMAVGGGTVGTALATQESHDLARDNPEVLRKYDRVWSFFTDYRSPYSYDEFKRQLSSPAERVAKDLHQRQVEADSRVANTMYFQYKDQFGPFPTTEEGDYLKVVKAKIQKQWPLWDQSFDATKKATEIKQAVAAANDPVFKDSKIAEAVRVYAGARAEVAADANASGFTSSESGWGKAKSTEMHRDYMRDVAAQLVEQVPEFKTLWERVFRGEMKDDVEGQP